MKIPKTDYRKIADCYDRVRHIRADVWASKIAEYGEIKDGSLALDIGCGTGSFAISLLSLRNATIFSVDNSSEMLKFRLRVHDVGYPSFGKQRAGSSRDLQAPKEGWKFA